MERDEWTLLGTIVDGGDVYRITEGTIHPVLIWRGDDRDPAGYVSAYQLRMAREGHTPDVAIYRIGHLAENHFQFRKAVARLVREPDPAAVIEISPVVIRPAATDPSIRFCEG